MSATILPVSDPNAIDRAAEILRGGGLVAMPTETVYGLAGDAGNGQTVARLYAAKGRPSFNPLIAHVTGVAMAQRLVEIPPLARKLMDTFWPGPLTLVLPKREDAPISDLANAGLDTVAIRCPAHTAARALIEAVDRPLVAPSANPSGAVSPTRAAHVAEGLGEKIDLILDGGECPVGLESAVVAVTGETATLLRPGGLARERIEAVTGPLHAAGESDAPASPGMLKSHYAPGAAVRLNATEAGAGELLLGFGTIEGDINLSPAGDLGEAAARLFSALRELDARGAPTIAVAPIPGHGLGEAINDRLRRAAAPRDTQ
ncbi:L-threonylcarbamoyladenylate synthase [Maricaulis sp.]|uniref:L-threonylcarbamoyladenylate synthase n=1 Tax=Maricaulis sp. TaxID=1486257 RepID=UPI00262BC3C0|nr:L-threonylcarbamoyladenylate synthase [Maricaulis sp.]